MGEYRVEVTGRISLHEQAFGTRVVHCTSDGTCTHDTRYDGAYASSVTQAFMLENIPGAMRRNGWHVGADLMQRWFAARAYQMTDSQKREKSPYPVNLIDTKLVKFGWALRFEKVETALRKLMQPGSLLSDGAKKLLTRRVVKLGFLEKACRVEHRPDLLNVPALHRDWQIQYVVANSDIFSLAANYFGRPDDLMAALGGFQICAAPARISVEPQPDGGAIIEVPEMATYIVDTYDFNGDQYLGHWNSRGVSLTMIDRNPYSLGDDTDIDSWYYPVENSTFSAWRSSRGRGGDFILFSDVHVESTAGLRFVASRSDILAARAS